MPEPITHTFVVNPTIAPRVEDHKYLFTWSGALVRGGFNPVITGAPETVTEKPLSEWKYRPSISAPVSRDIKPQKVPDLIPDRIREQLDLGRSAEPEVSPDSVSRPNLAAAFDQWQTKARYRTDNPVLNELDLQTFCRNFYSVPDVSDPAYYAGVSWVLANLTTETMGLQLIQSDRVFALRHAAIDIAWGHMIHHKPLEIVEAILEQFQIRSLNPLIEAITAKLKSIAQEQNRWADMALVPVLDTDGTVLRSLTLCNIAAAYVGVKQLDGLAATCHSFCCGAEDAVLRLQSLPQHLAPSGGI